MPASGNWECSKCLLSNEAKLDTCPLCQTAKPGDKEKGVADNANSEENSDKNTDSKDGIVQQPAPLSSKVPKGTFTDKSAIKGGRLRDCVNNGLKKFVPYRYRKVSFANSEGNDENTDLKDDDEDDGVVPLPAWKGGMLRSCLHSNYKKYGKSRH